MLMGITRIGSLIINENAFNLLFIIAWAVRTLSPAGDSPWEQGKAAFFPLLAAGPVIWYLAGGGSRSGLCAMAIAGGGTATVLALAGAAPAIAAGGAIAAAVALYGGVLRRLKERGGWFAAAIALTAAYILLTIVRPGGALFEAAMGIPF